MKNFYKKLGFSTKAIHVGEEPNYSASGDVVIPIHLSSTFARKELDKPSSAAMNIQEQEILQEMLWKKS
jgi:cystathionine beta-lyase/cystathionine gamma-synthase